MSVLSLIVFRKTHSCIFQIDLATVYVEIRYHAVRYRWVSRPSLSVDFVSQNLCCIFLILTKTSNKTQTIKKLLQYLKFTPASKACCPNIYWFRVNLDLKIHNCGNCRNLYEGMILTKVLPRPFRHLPNSFGFPNTSSTTADAALYFFKRRYVRC